MLSLFQTFKSFYRMKHLILDKLVTGDLSSMSVNNGTFSNVKYAPVSLLNLLGDRFL